MCAQGSPRHWPPEGLPEYVGGAAFHQKMRLLASRLRREFPQAAAEDAVFDAVVDFIERALRADEHEFLARFPAEKHALRYISVAARRRALALMRRLRKERTVPYVRNAAAPGEPLPDRVFRNEVISYLVRIVSGDFGDTPDEAGLTAREREVIARIWRGQTLTEIARALRRAPSTISARRDSAIEKIRRRFGLHDD